MSAPIQQFEARLQKAGLSISAGLQADGRLHRCGTTDKPKGQDGAYKVHLDDPASLWWCNWQTGDSGTWCAKADTDLTAAEREALRQRIEADRKAAESERAERQAEAAQRATVIWDAAQPATTDHPYLAKKQVPSLGLRLAKDGRLIAPLLDGSGKIVSLQFIAGDGNKRFLKDGKAAGGFFPIPAKDGSKDGPLCIAEGYATCATIHEATGYAVFCSFNASNLLAVAQMARRRYPEREIILCADRDSPTDKYPSLGGVGVSMASEAARAIGGMLAIPRRDGHTKIDFNDLANLMGTSEVLHQIMARREPDPLPEQTQEDGKESAQAAITLRCDTLADFLALELPEREMLLKPVLPRQGLMMIHAQRGIGKTFVGLSAAYAVASGSPLFDRWAAPKPAKVLFLDGEMPARTLQERLDAIVLGSKYEPPDGDYLRIVTPDRQDGPMPNVATRDGQDAVEPLLAGVSLVVIDNISTLARHGRANDEESWIPIQSWLLDLRRRGIACLLIHHQGKGGDQRGTSAKEDILDTVASLRRPQDYHDEEGARFEVRLTKARGVFGREATPFEAQLLVEAGRLSWLTRDIEDCQLETLRKLLADGYTVRDAAEEMAISKSACGRLKKKLDALQGKMSHFSRDSFMEK